MRASGGPLPKRVVEAGALLNHNRPQASRDPRRPALRHAEAPQASPSSGGRDRP
jgi:hypothetical protein